MVSSGASWTYSATGLPAGLTINKTTGVISGKVTGAAQAYSATVTATDSKGGGASTSFTWNVSVLSLTNPGTQNSAVGDAVSLATSASGLPSGDTWTYSATGLPAGLSINKTTGVISGTVTGSAEAYSVTVTASDGHGGTISQTFNWNVSALSLSNPGDQYNARGDTVALSPIQGGGAPAGATLTYTATGLPAGLSIDATTGVISGTVTGAVKAYSVTVKVSDGLGASTSVSFTWTITVLSLTNPGTQSAAVGTTINPLPIVASGLPAGDSLTYSATNLPLGLSINAITGVISGTLTGAKMNYSVTVMASDGDGASVSVTFTFDVT
jgi:hypothetical protein